MQPIALFFESQAIATNSYYELIACSDRFPLIFTHSSQVLESCPNARWIPGGGIWIGGTYAGGFRSIFEKSRNTSFLTSGKLMCDMHLERLKLAKSVKRLKHTQLPIDVFINKKWPQKYTSVFETLRDFRFSIVIENFIDRHYFTEKLLNCFATGTIPVYWGATDIGDIFDISGIVTFSSQEEFMDETRFRLTPELYSSSKSAIEANFRAAERFSTIEDFMYTRYKAEIDYCVA